MEHFTNSNEDTNPLPLYGQNLPMSQKSLLELTTPKVKRKDRLMTGKLGPCEHKKLKHIANREQGRASKCKSSMGRPSSKPRRRTLCQYRSNLDNVVKVISEIAFTEVHKSKLKQVCPFWKLCAAIFEGELTRQKCRKSDIQMLNIINKYDTKRKGFKISKHFATIKRDQMQQIFGIYNKGTRTIEVTPEGKNTPAYKKFVDMWFQGISVMTKRSIEMALTDAVNGTTDDDIDDVARIVTLFLLDTLFVTKSCMSLAWGYLKFVHGDVRNMKSYDWATHIYEKLIESMDHHNPARLPGCVIAIPYIILENFSLCTPEEGIKYTKTVLCIKWNLKEFFNMMVECKTVDALLDDEAVDQNPEETQSCKKMRNLVDVCNNYVAVSPRAWKSASQDYLARNKTRVTTDKTPPISNSYVCLGQDKSGNAVGKSPIVANINSWTRRVELEKQHTFEITKAQFKGVPFPQENVEVNHLGSFTGIESAMQPVIENPNTRIEHVPLSSSNENDEVNNSLLPPRSHVPSNLNPPGEEQDKPSEAIIIDGTNITSQIPEPMRTIYLDLCRSQKKLLHMGLPEGIPPDEAISTICRTVTIANKIKAYNMCTQLKDIDYWNRALGSYASLGMDVGFMRNRVNNLLNIKKKAMDLKKDLDGDSKGEELEEKIRGFESCIEELKETMRGFELEIERTRERSKMRGSVLGKRVMNLSLC